MSSDPSNFVVRRPRYRATGRVPVVLTIVRASELEPAVVPAELLDVSRHGMRLKLAVPLAMDEPILIRLKEAEGGLERSFRAHVLWRFEEGQDAWIVGCPLEGEIDWEALGELFLHEVLDP